MATEHPAQEPLPMAGDQAEERIARAVRDATLAVPGTVALVPGLAGSVRAMARRASGRSAGAAGYGVDFEGGRDGLRLRLHLVVDLSRPTATIAREVQRRAAEAIQTVDSGATETAADAEIDVAVVEIATATESVPPQAAHSA